MGKLLIEESSLTSIGDAIRAKTGKSAKLSPAQMVAEIESISGGGDLPTFSYDFSTISSATGSEPFAFIGVITKKAIEAGMVEKQILIDSSAKSPAYVYMKTPDAKLPDLIISVASSSCVRMFNYSAISKEENLPKISTTGSGSVSSISYFFSYCTYLRNIPEDYFDNMKITSSATCSNMFEYCYSLRSVPSKVFSKLTTTASYSGQPSYYGFYSCYSIEEIVGLPIASLSGTNAFTTNTFLNTFMNCHRLSRLVFNAPESSYRMKSQTIDLSSNIGYGSSYNFSEAMKRNAGYTTADLVNSDATYAAKKNSPNWYTQDIKWSRYNKVSAIETIASLPDTSAYLASAGGTNTIKFRGNSGSNTDGGAINTMTAEEIAVATAKGWTVTFA